tara:strand:- start:2293 stop:2940 length:648 start_codon:yes stop_codon:yes gene_type:complete
MLPACDGEMSGASDSGASTADLSSLGTSIEDLGGGEFGRKPGPSTPVVDGETGEGGRTGHLGETTDVTAPKTFEGLPLLTWEAMRLPDDRLDDLLDSLIYPDEYTEEEARFPDHLTALDGERIAVRGYMIPVTWEEGAVTQLMLVGDLLACCFGIAPEPDQWVDCHMMEDGADYFIQVPVVIKGILHIKGIADEAGYSAGCYVFEAESLVRTDWD